MKKIYLLFVMFGFLSVSATGEEVKNAQPAKAEEQTQKQSDDAPKKNEDEHSQRYYFFFHFLTEGINIPDNYAEFKKNFRTEKLQLYWKAVVDEELAKPTDDAKNLEVSKLDWSDEAWLLKFPEPKSMPLPSYGIIYSKDGKNARYFTLEKTLKFDETEGPKKPALICECTNVEGEFTHLNYGIKIDQDDRDAFIEKVKAMTNKEETPKALMRTK